MDTLTLRLQRRSPFGSPLLGDMLFGQLCWALRHRHGEAHLQACLEGYTAGRPFAVISDALPVGYLPRPALPLSLFPEIPGADRKQVKKRLWLPLAALERSMTEWLAHCCSEAEVVAACAPPQQTDAPPAPHPKTLTTLHPQPHNSINRLTGTTGQGEFAPYTQMQRWSADGVDLCLRLVFDAERIDAETLTDLLNDIGAVGFGRDASIGLGKFEVTPLAQPWPAQADANACLTLAPCAPQGQGCRADRSYYEVFTRFGRHGDQAVQLGNPFKTPVLLARAGALLTPSRLPSDPLIGQGLGGDGRLSKVIPETVQQGYAPCVAVHLPEEIAP
ncbi:CRISPR-associated protein Csm7 [Lamprobacter modestohalophilus]|uniref:type III-A CRISPR-associated RAMP protein Csm4 n=1 Tax=Lamprobacter modestohalophilus TaxID=1064514 RepID=UPI002ADEB981|nr:CRISPR-associated protein Csm7 [Lamprobacter modestohalophilus]MEA1051764.1 CRISPR-associated protein Csm7 [Lamprobacter modestohalophilus]